MFDEKRFTATVHEASGNTHRARLLVQPGFAGKVEIAIEDKNGRRDLGILRRAEWLDPRFAKMMLRNWGVGTRLHPVGR